VATVAARSTTTVVSLCDRASGLLDYRVDCRLGVDVMKGPRSPYPLPSKEWRQGEGEMGFWRAIVNPALTDRAILCRPVGPEAPNRRIGFALLRYTGA
jgi:hypothetical protein